jgi:tRNA(Ile)-lysidine synthase
MSRNLKEKVHMYIVQHHMIRESDVVCVGCSGGADSTLLLVLLCELQAENAFGFPFFTAACHVNHHLRGSESDGDEQFVRDLCRKLDVPLWCAQEDVQRRAAENGLGLEEAGREARIAVFGDCLKNRGATKIALAHHADDQAETVLYHLARGAALTGLSGMRPVNGPVIRPLLAVTHLEICAELERREIRWRTDSSNASELFARNRIRHGLIPELEREVHQGAARHIAGTAEIVRMADDFIAEETKSRARKYVRTFSEGEAFPAGGRSGRGSALYIDGALCSEPEIIRRGVLLESLCTLAGRKKDIGRVHVESLLALFGREIGKRVDLPYGICAFRESGGIALFVSQEAEKLVPAALREMEGAVPLSGWEPEKGGFALAVTGRAEPVRITKSGVYRFDDARIEVRIMSRRDMEECMKDGRTTCSRDVSDGGIKCSRDVPDDGAACVRVPQKTYTKWLNYDKIKKGLLIRNRLPGDYLTLDEDGRKQKLKSYFINSKIGRDKRDRIILLAEDSHVYWAVGGRISAAAKIGPDTERVIQIAVTRTDGNGGSGIYG